jgi:hypothetical protein
VLPRAAAPDAAATAAAPDAAAAAASSGLPDVGASRSVALSVSR